ncbi:MAG TPA: DUF1080 domain-containing protein [Candidatus Hydrogenedentes bacterium]|nr:DUF1080 domain-containing protein [Candidatus Hydrogenedentota bacterium]HPG65948.1 DUF1080 domain-containing protein [Candidatus Hydrogenedentota bacterium]
MKRIASTAATVLMLCACAWAEEAKQAEEAPKAEETAPLEKADVVDFSKWAETDFYGRGKVRVEEGVAYLERGNDMTGITWKGPLDRMNYEISVEAMRVEGEDFFCGLTFPVGEDPCSFIVGGWGGTVCGLSSLDYNDAYNNETARFRKFEKNRWYKIRVRVTENHIQAWIDDEPLVDVDTTDRKVGIRWEVERSVPLGIATWQTSGAIRNFTMNPVPPEERKEERPEI